jgi:hypothetical protein
MDCMALHGAVWSIKWGSYLLYCCCWLLFGLLLLLNSSCHLFGFAQKLLGTKHASPADVRLDAKPVPTLSRMLVVPVAWQRRTMRRWCSVGRHWPMIPVSGSRPNSEDANDYNSIFFFSMRDSWFGNWIQITHTNTVHTQMAATFSDFGAVWLWFIISTRTHAHGLIDSSH